MEHFYNYLQKKGKDNLIKDLSNTSLKISEKIDGTPLQVVNEDEKFSFHSKGKDMNTPGPLLTSLDLVMNPAFYKQCEYLKKAISKCVSEMQIIKILNIEIVVDNTHHIVQYGDKPENNMYILSGSTIYGHSLSQKALEGLSKRLNVSVAPYVYFDKCPIESIIDFVESYGDPKSPNYNDIKFKNKLNDILYKGDGKNFINQENIEGVVLEFGTGLTLKIDSPYFLNTFKDNKEKKMSDDEENEINNLLNKALSLIDKKKLSKKSNDQLENLILNFNATIASSRESLLDFMKACNATKKSRNIGIIDAIPKKYHDQLNLMKDDVRKIWFISFINFAWLFRKKRKGLLSGANEIVDLIT